LLCDAFKPLHILNADHLDRHIWICKVTVTLTLIKIPLYS
jgi:hypothetical protein